MIDVILVGNPNTGKTTLYNTLTGKNEHVGNWHGVTVEEKFTTYSYQNHQIRVVDLPGIYHTTPLSFEEKVATDYIYNNRDKLIVNICDASNLTRNLYLTLGLLELGANVILFVNQIDKKPIRKVDYAKLENLLGIKIIYGNASHKKEVQRLNQAIVDFQICDNVKYRLPYIKNIDFSPLKTLKNAEKLSIFLKIKLLEDDEMVKSSLNIQENFDQIEQIAQVKYKYIDEIIGKCCDRQLRVYGKSKLDKILLNRYLALPIFLLLLCLVFYLTFFSLGKFLSDGLGFIFGKILFSPLSNLVVSKFGAESAFTSLVQEALIGGVGSVLSFLPQVALLFFFLSILEDSGYLARIAFTFDDILSKVGLSGKSVYTLLMGFGCSTSAVMTARNMEDKNSKIKTGLLTPYMSCSAKFPIYTVLGGAFFGANNIFVILGLYILGVVIAVLLSYIFEKTSLKSKQQSFILEFPPYRAMNLKRVFKLLWQNIKSFITRIASIIVAMNIVLWFLSHFTAKLEFISSQSSSISLLQTFGMILSPIFAPLGFGSWGAVSALLAGLVAKEVIVSSIAMFNGVESANLSALQSSLLISTSAVHFLSPASALSFLVFCLLYFPCVATFSVLLREIGFKWTLIGSCIEFVVAYLCAFVICTLARSIEYFGMAQVLSILFVAILIIVSLLFLRNRLKKKACPYSDHCGRCKR